MRLFISSGKSEGLERSVLELRELPTPNSAAKPARPPKSDLFAGNKMVDEDS